MQTPITTYFSALILLMLTICQIPSAKAQSQASDFRAKIILGVNGSQLDGDGLSGYNQPGALLGAGMAIQLNDRWSFEPEILFSQLGARSSNREFDLTGRRQRIRLNYFELPVMFNYNISGQYVLSAGVSPMVLVSGRTDFGENMGYETTTDQFNTVTGNAMAAIEYYASPRVALNLRFSYGLWSTAKVSSEDYWARSLAGYRFGLINNTITFSVRYVLSGSLLSK